MRKNLSSDERARLINELEEIQHEIRAMIEFLQAKLRERGSPA